MHFQWDAGNINHIALHGITPYEAEQVFANDPLIVQVQIRNGENRVLHLGETDTGRVLFVAVTERHEGRRVVTAYPANRKMRAFYLAQKGGTHG